MASEHQEPLLESERDSQDLELSELQDGAQLSRIPAAPNKSTSILLIAVSLFVTIAGYVVSTEAGAYYVDVLGWNKPFCSMYILHSSLALPWLCHLSYLGLRQRNKAYLSWVQDYNNELRASISAVEAFATSGSSFVFKRKGSMGGSLDYLATVMGIVFLALTVSGASWFISVALTTPGDLTAIYNCSTFFAAVFSIPILRQRLGSATIAAVALSILGTVIIAYGDTASHPEDDSAPPPQVGASRLVGNLVALLGAVAFGLYEVLFKKWACPSKPVSPQSSLHLTFAASALTGIYTFFTFWIVLLVLHILDIETFELPTLEAAGFILLSMLSGLISMTSQLLLVTWTNPVFSSVASVLSVFFVAIADWLVFGLVPSIGTYIGGVLIMVAFGLLARDELGQQKH